MDSTLSPAEPDTLAAPSSATDGDPGSGQNLASSPSAVDIKRIGGLEGPREVDEAERRRLALAATERTEDQRRSARQVNEYVLWAIENEMWKEARLHLERAVLADSLASSLYNNLALVYERLGLPDKAEQAYERASILNPGRQAYGVNLRRLRERLERAERFEPDRLDSLKEELDDLGIEPGIPAEARQRTLTSSGE